METIPPVSPYLTVRGGVAALEFYKTAFEAEQTSPPMLADDGKRVMHAAFTIQGGMIMLSDEFPEHDREGGGTTWPESGKLPPAAVILNYPAPADVDATYERALKAGATSHMAPEDTFWGARFATVVDPFGHHWMLHAPLKK